MNGPEATSNPNNLGNNNSNGTFKQRNNRPMRGNNTRGGNPSRLSSRGRGGSQRQFSGRQSGDARNYPDGTNVTNKNSHNNNNNNNNNNTNNNNNNNNLSLNMNTGNISNMNNVNRPKPHIYTTTSQRPPSGSGGKVPTQKYSSIESQFVGSFIGNPESIGYSKFNHRPTPIPKYLMKEQVQFHTLPFNPNQWDVQNQAKMLKMETEHRGDAQTLFEQFQEIRAEERKMMEDLNLVDIENAKKSLSDALIFKGTCVDMCPTYERVERTFKNQVSKWEKDPATNKISRDFALKTFIRPSGQAPSLPSDVRPPHILVKTLDYITDVLLPKLPDTQSFIWDRTRSIRQDFTFQNNYSGPEAVECHEKICRIHLLSLHIMAGANDPDYQQQQEIEQFINSLQTLTHMYNDVRSRGGICPNEAEFRAYELLSNLRDSEMDRNIQQLPIEIFESEIVQCALMLRGMVIQPAAVGSFNNYTQFFSVINNPRTPFLLACLAESHFNEIRFNALKLMARSFHSKAIPPKIGILSSWLGFDNEQEFMKTVDFLKIPYVQDPNTGDIKLDISVLNHQEFKSSQKQAYTTRLNDKIQGKQMSDIINAGKPNGPFGIPMDKNTKLLESIARESLISQRSGSGSGSGIAGGNSVDSLLDSTKVPVMAEATLVTSGNVPLNTNSVPQTTNGAASFVFGAGNNLTSANNGVASNAQSFNFSMPSSQQQPQQQPRSSSVQHLPEIPQLSIPPTIQPAAVEKPKVTPITQEPNFKNSSIKVVEEILSEFMKKEVPKVVKHSYEREVKRREQEMKMKQEELKRVQEQQRQLNLQKQEARSRTIESLSKELLSSFLKEQIYIATMENMAESFANKTLKRNVFNKVSKQASASYEKMRYKKRKLDEIEQYVNNINVPKESSFKKLRTLQREEPSSLELKKKKFVGMFRNISTGSRISSSSSSPLVSFSDESSRIEKPKGPEYLADSSGPIDLKSLVLNVFPSHSSLQLNVLVVSSSTIEKTDPSRWLVVSKLGMKFEPQLKSYFKLIAADKRRLLISLLPQNRAHDINFKPMHWFKNQNVIIFEVILDSDNVTSQLLKYRDDLNELIRDVRRHGRRQVSLLLTIFNSSSKVSDSDILQVLNCDDLLKEPKVKQLKLVNLSDFYKCGGDRASWRSLSDKLSNSVADLAAVFKTDPHSSNLGSGSGNNTSMNRSTGSLLYFNQSTLSDIGASSSMMNNSNTPETSMLRNKRRERRNEYILSQLAMSNNYLHRKPRVPSLLNHERIQQETNQTPETQQNETMTPTISMSRYVVREKPVSSELSKSLGELQELARSVRSGSGSVAASGSTSRRASVVEESFNDSLIEMKDLIHGVLGKKK